MSDAITPSTPQSSVPAPAPQPIRDIAADVRWPRELDAEYEYLGELGRGGMAIVYHARDKELHRDVAVKVVRTRYAQDHEAVARLAREARTVAHLEHPNIVALHAVKRLGDDSLALVMQLVPGKTLKQALRDEGAFAPDRVERVLRDVARGLAYAHARGIVHRDVKPENIFLDEESGRALLSDFGVAISRDADTSLTATGTAIGTPTYMSPEQIDGARVDGRSDLYSLGLVAWEMITGRRPWDGESLYSVIYRQKHEELLPIEDIRPDVSERLRYIVDGLLRKQPVARWASAERLLTRLNDASDPPGLKQWRQYKKKHAKQRRETARAVPNDAALPEAPTEHFRRSAEQRAIAEERIDLRSTPQTIRVETSATPMDEWSVEDDGSVTRRNRYGKWLVAAGIVLVTAVGALLLTNRPPPPNVAQGDSARSTFTDAGTIEVPAVRPETTATKTQTDTAVAATPTPIATAQRDSTPPTVTQLPAAKQAVTSVIATPPVTGPPARTPDTPNATPSLPSLGFPREVARVSAGTRHSCVLVGGKAQCWGNNENGQLGNGTVDLQVTPVSVVGDFTFAQLSAGDWYTCGVTTGGEARCWGANDAGQLGDGTVSSRTAPVLVSAGGHNFSAIRAGRSHTCGLTTSGAVFCWGNNRDGQLGDGSRSNRSSPVRVALPGPAARIAAGGGHTCALLIDGSAYCWGSNTFGQLGDSTKTSRGEPARVSASVRFLGIGSGRDHTCAVTVDNAAYCWGRNSSGQAGVGSNSDAVPVPQKVETTVRFQTIAAGLSHTCALSMGGTAYCWGRNSYGQLGDGGTDNRTRPAAVQGAGALVALFPGASHTCGVNSSNETFCWGYNVDGQLGNGGKDNSAVPVKVQDPSR